MDILKKEESKIIEMRENELTPKQEAFCNYYIEGGNASSAYRLAYNAVNMKPETVNVKAAELLANGKVSVRVEELKNELKERSDITKEKILSELGKIAFSSIAHLHNTWIELKDFEKLTREQTASIKSISTKVQKKNVGTSEKSEIIDVGYVKVELYDKLKALDSINKMLGFDAPTKIDVASNGDKVEFKGFSFLPYTPEADEG